MDFDTIEPHDLLWVSSSAAIDIDGPRPPWAGGQWLLGAPLVVRRENMNDTRLPVGLRGAVRSERCKAYVERGAVTRCVKPEMLASALAVPLPGPLPEFAALTALAALAPALDATALAWGPTGGVGFFLASGLPVLRRDSDLDLLVRAPRRPGEQSLAALVALQAYADCRVDIQIDTGHGAFALAEWTRTRGRVLLKTGAGPILTDDPWQHRLSP
jgi:phosphoribosyl-dephospho-CoA transferase